MNKIIIKQTNHHGCSTKLFRAYSGSLRGGQVDLPLGVTASSTADPASIGAGYCALKTFRKLAESTTDPDELRTRIALKEVSLGSRIWEATLQPKCPCDTLSDTRPL